MCQAMTILNLLEFLKFVPSSFPPLVSFKCWEALCRGYLVFTLNEQMDNRTKFDTVDNEVVFFFVSTFAVLVSRCYETILVDGYPYNTPTLYQISEAIL